MKILEVVDAQSIPNRGASKWVPVLDELAKLPDGKSLPVDCDTKSGALALQSFLFGRHNNPRYNFPKHSCQRKGTVVYITKAVNGKA